MTDQDSVAQLLTAKRILVLGSSGSGKTTFSRHLGQLLGLRPIHLDAHFWRPGWINTPQPQWRQVVAELIQMDAWIMDGTYESTLDLRIPAADCLVLIDQSRLTCLWRIIKRKATIDDQRRPDAPPGQVVDMAFLRYVWKYPTVTQPQVEKIIRQHGSGKTQIRLRGDRQIRQFLSHVGKAVASQPPSKSSLARPQ